MTTAPWIRCTYLQNRSHSSVSAATSLSRSSWASMTVFPRYEKNRALHFSASRSWAWRCTDANSSSGLIVSCRPRDDVWMTRQQKNGPSSEIW